MKNIKKLSKILFLFIICFGFGINAKAATKACLIDSNGKLSWDDINVLKSNTAGYFGTANKTKANCKGYLELTCVYKKEGSNNVKWTFTQNSKGVKKLINQDGKEAEASKKNQLTFPGDDCRTKVYYVKEDCGKGIFKDGSSKGWTWLDIRKCESNQYNTYTLVTEESKSDTDATVINNGQHKVDTKEDVINKDNSSDSTPSTDAPITSCDSLPKTMKLLKKIYNFLKYMVPVIIIGLGMLDFIKAITSDDEKVFKEAWSKLMKRILVGVVILILPVILEFLINISGVINEEGLDKNNLFCIFTK